MCVFALTAVVFTAEQILNFLSLAITCNMAVELSNVTAVQSFN